MCSVLSQVQFQALQDTAPRIADSRQTEDPLVGLPSLWWSSPAVHSPGGGGRLAGAGRAKWLL